MIAVVGVRDPTASGYTSLGQFVDHDITFDPVSSLQRQNDPDALHNFRTPRFDLDSVHGRGPADQPYLYDQSNGTTKLELGESVAVVPDEPSGGRQRGDRVSLVRSKFQCYRPDRQAYIPVEFSVAAYRFGHSMIRGRYDINRFVEEAGRGQGPIPTFGPERPPDELANLNGSRRAHRSGRSRGSSWSTWQVPMSFRNRASPSTRSWPGRSATCLDPSPTSRLIRWRPAT